MRRLSSILIVLLIAIAPFGGDAVKASSPGLPCHHHKAPVQGPVSHACCQQQQGAALLKVSQTAPRLEVVELAAHVPGIPTVATGIQPGLRLLPQNNDLVQILPLRI